MSGKKGLIAALAAAVLFGICLAGCQPTPEKEAVVNRAEGIPQEALREPDDAGKDDGEERYEPVEYAVSEHWKEDIAKSDSFTVQADVDVMTPQVDAYPVQKLEKADLTQERVDELVAYFTQPGSKFYQMPLPLTKEYYEDELIRLKEDLARVEAGGDGETPESIRDYIAEVEEKWADAPEEVTPVEADTNFTYEYDYETGEPNTEKGEDYIYVSVEDGSGLNKRISATRPGSAGYGSYFSYGDCSFERESDLLSNEAWMEDNRVMLQYMEEPYKSEQAAQIAQEEEHILAKKELYAQNGVNLKAMQEKAVEMLRELNIPDVQIVSCEKALLGPLPNDFSTELPVNDQPGAFIEFQRQCGGVPCFNQMGGGMSDDMSLEGMYSAPFYPEQGYIVFDTDGDVRMFSWDNIAGVTETVSGDSDILPFEEAKERIVDHLYWRSIDSNPDAAANDAGMKLRYEIEDAKLIMSYINVKNEPEKVLAVPAWYVKVQGYYTVLDEESIINGVEMYRGEEELTVSALDGSPILMPGMQEIAERIKMEEAAMEEGA